MDQAGIATLAVIVVLIAAGVGTIGTPLIVDAVDVQPDSPLYSLERAGESIKGAFAGGQDWEIERAQERDDEFVYMVDAGKAGEYTWLVEESDVHLLKAAKLAGDNEGLQKAIEANVSHLVLLENIKERVLIDAKPAISFAQLQSYASVGVLENVARGVHLKIPEPLKIELDNRLSRIRVAIENMRIENVEPLEFTIRIENYERIKPEQITLEVENAYTLSVFENLPTVAVTAVKVKFLSSLRIEPHNAWLGVGDFVDFTATAVYSDGSTQNVTLGATWELSNPAIGNISYSIYIDLTRGSSGSYAVFHAEKTGYTWITANYHGYSDEVPVVVSESPPPAAFGELKLTAFSDERKVLPHLSIFMENEVTIGSIEDLYFVNVGAAVTVGDWTHIFLCDVYAYFWGAHGIEKGDGLTGFGALRYEPDVYIDAFSDGFWIGRKFYLMNQWVWTNKDVYLVGENVTIYFKNRAEESLIFGAAPTWHIERYRADEWKLVRIYPPDLAWPMVLTGIEPGEIKSSTWDQKIYIGSRENYEEIQAESGRYRVVWSPKNLETGEPVGEFKSEFRIENIIIQEKGTGNIRKYK